MTQKTPNDPASLPVPFGPLTVRARGLDRDVEATAPDWDEVHRMVQQQFQGLHRCLSQRWLNCRAEYGRSHGRIFPLYSHVSFDDPTCPHKLAIVVGIEFEYAASEGMLTMRADIVREEVGDILYQDVATDVPNRKPDVLAKAEEMGRRLCDHHALVAAGLDLSPSDVSTAN
jgi:hypothetical protein